LRPASSETAPPGFGPVEYARAVVNILEDFSAEKARLQDTQRAVLNILADFGEEKIRLEQMQKAVLNVLQDFGEEKIRLEQMQKAVLNILEDLAVEKARLERTQEEVRRSERAIRASLREKEVLLQEIHHRVKNNLQVISSLLNLHARYLPDAGARTLFGECQDRVQSIALVHEQLYQSADLAHIDFGQYAAALVDRLFHTYDASDQGLRREVDAHGRLTIDLAIPCGLIVNELVTNALKHAFPGGRAGTIRVGLCERPDGALELSVADDGVGLPETPAPHASQKLGLDLVYTFAEQLDARMAVEHEGGTTFRFSFRREDT
jgi:two-component sensor histidine kinase